MSIPGSVSPLFFQAAAAAAADVNITKSLRFNSGDSAHLSKTFSSAGNRDTWTWSAWIKIADFSASDPYNFIFGAGASDEFYICQRSSQEIHIRQVTSGSEVISLITDQEFRDVAGWGHLVVAVDTGQATSSNRIKVYWNGSQITSFSTSTYPSQNLDTHVNNNVAHYIGKRPNGTIYLDAYLADVYFIGGSQLEPTSFGAFDSNGVWQAALYSGTYGTNGFHLAFGDSSSSAALGTDSSGNSNTFTVNNISGDAVGLATANQGFDVVTYTGTGSTQSISGLNFQSDLVWIKPRNVSDHHILYDSVRGVRKQLYTTLTNAEETETQGLSAFTSDGFTVNGAHTVRGQTNDSSNTYVAWCWKAGGSASSNTDGTITSSVSASTTYGFSVVAYTGNNTSGATVGHSLSSVPKWIVVKSRGQAGQFWHVYHASLAANEYIYLNSNAAKTSGNDFMNGTRPTSSVFSLGNGNGCNKSSDNVIAYCWSEVSGFSKFSSFSGTGSSGNAVTTGFKPRLVLLKRTDTTGNWFIFDSERGTGGTVWADLSDAEESNYSITLRNDGFNVNGSAAGMNASGGTYIYAAFASKPSGEEIDSLFDVPTNGTQSDTGAGGEVSGNHATLNPLSSGSGVTLSNGNLDMANSSSGSTRVAFSSIGMSAGKYYCEFTCVSGDYAIGLADGSFAQGQYVGLDSTHYSYFQNGKKYNGGSNQTYGSSFTDGDVIGIAFDADAGNLYFYKNGTVQNSGTAAFTGLTNGPYFFAFGDASMNGSVNFGQRAFKYGNAGTNRPAATYKTLCTTNLPTPTIADGSDYFDTKLYTGNGTSQTISGLSFSPD